MDDKKIRILLVDDEADFTQPMAFWFKSKGYDVDVAQGGESALKIVKKNPPDIILLDLNMPGMDGIEVLKRVREFNKSVPVVIVSAYIDRLMVQEAEPFDVSGVFYKGEDFEEGLSLLESVLRTHKKLKR